jgi:hypothetical protein
VPWPTEFFVTFNLFWLGMWGVSVWALRARWHAALVPLWFLGIAGAVNGIAHPVLAAGSGGYYPGLVTALLVGAAGVALLRRLTAVTSPV